ncbi:MAG: alpha/beta fold hydrolase [Oleiphilaceae bacterium]|nr:alpha/beta fold hydrolase [Oleiphilaceae bacterium]
MPVKSTSAETVTLHASSAGEGPPVILLHGLFGAGDNLGGIRRRLQHRFRLHSLDLRNHGQSPHAGSMSYPEMAADVRAWMDANGLASAAVLGHSMGGKVAMELALGDPGRVDRLIVADIAPVAYEPHHDGILEGMQSLDTGALSSRREADRALSSSIDDSRVRQFLLTNLVPAEQGFRWRLNLPGLVDCYPQIMAAPQARGPYQGPVLFLKGGESDYIDKAHQQATEKRFPRARLRVVPGAGHWLHGEKPDLVARLCERFLSGAMDRDRDSNG